MGQIVIKVLLLAAFAGLAFLLVSPGRGARNLAVRRLTLLAVLAAGVVAVIVPDWLTALANLVGVGRGADLLLYGLAVLVVGQLVRGRAHDNDLRRQITDLARHVAILEAEPAEERAAVVARQLEEPDAAAGA